MIQSNILIQLANENLMMKNQVRLLLRTRMPPTLCSGRLRLKFKDTKSNVLSLNSNTLFWMISGIWGWGDIQMIFMSRALKNKGWTIKASLLPYDPFQIRSTGAQIRECLLQVQRNLGNDVQIWVTFFIYEFEFGFLHLGTQGLRFWGI